MKAGNLMPSAGQAGQAGLGIALLLQHVLLLMSFYGLLSSFCIPYHRKSAGTETNLCSYAFIRLLRVVAGFRVENI